MFLLLNIYFRAAFVLLKNPPNIYVFINYVRYFISRFRKNKSIVSHTPTNIVIYTTKSCNLNCSFCFIGDDLNPPNPKNYELTYEKYEKLKNTKFFRNTLRLGLLGGEPFIASDIFRILEDLKKQGKVTTVVTNAMLLKKEKLDKLEECPPVILGMSLYENNSKDIERVYNRLKNKTIIWIQTIIESDNYENVKEALNLCLKIGCKNLRISNYYPTYGVNITKTIFDDDKEYIKFKKEIHKKYKRLINIDWPATVQKEIKSKKCLQPLSYIHTDNNGNIGACFMRSPNAKKFGNIFDKNAWNNKETMELRNSIYNINTECDPWCRYCENLGEDLYKI